jgi:hypothetical protein
MLYALQKEEEFGEKEGRFLTLTEKKKTKKLMVLG